MSEILTIDLQSDLVAINKYVAKQLDLRVDKWGIHQEIIIRTGKNGLRYKEISIIFEKRMHGIFNLKTLKYLFTAFLIMIKALIRK